MAEFLSKYSGDEIDELLGRVANGSSGGGGTGTVGPQGPQGEQGEQGPAGADGKDGVSITSVVQTTTSTADGGSNVVTVTLSDGKTSTFTVKNGSKGSQGDKGDKGDKGEQGEQGVQGIQGPEGPQGIQGVQGPEGPQGATGSQGAKGDKGDTGANGATFTPSVDSAGNLSWTNNGGLANPPTVNIKGPKGDSGEGGSGGGKEIVPVDLSSGSIAFNQGRNIPFEPNKIYYATSKVTDNIAIQWVIPPTADVAEYSLYFSTDVIFGHIMMDIPAEWLWTNGEVPEIDTNKNASYELSVVATKVNGSFIYKAVLTKFE